MATPAAATGPIVRSGPSLRLGALLPLTVAAAASGTLQLTDPAGRPVGPAARVTLRGRGDLARLRARLDPTTPPGRYRAELAVGDQHHVLDVEVEPTARLRAEPPMLRLRGVAGAAVTATLWLSNAGNTAVTVPEVAVLGTFDSTGVEDAFAEAYRSEAEDGLAVLGTFVLALRARHGGLLKLRVAEGAGDLAPGASRALRLEGRLPTGLAPARVYTGTWPLASLRYAVEITVPAAAKEDVR